MHPIRTLDLKVVQVHAATLQLEYRQHRHMREYRSLVLANLKISDRDLESDEAAMNEF